MTAIDMWIRALDYTQRAADETLPGLLDRLAVEFDQRPALLSFAGVVSYADLVERVNRCARWALDQGVGKGDVICLMMSNRPEYVAIWLGLTRIGCTVALLNTNLRGDALRHCIEVAGSTTVISTGEFLDVITVPRLRDWDRVKLEEYSVLPLTDVPLPVPDDRALLIYSSGTTGMPKAINITHRRIVEWSFWFAGMIDTQPTDRLYNCLPMYHSVGGIVAIGAMLVKGGSVFIRERFSARRFWDDVVDNGCTIFQYIGELSRYLTLSEPHPKERQHQLRLACGNGMQEGVWRELQERFAIPQVLEFYAATEGNLSLYNCEGKPGAIGRVPPFLAQRFAVAIIQCDVETGEALRGPDGFCVPCATNEAGEAISRLGAVRRFDGYSDPVASQRKILHDVFVEGDRWFRSGDLMRRDAKGYFYFIDRLGDTFRWKGENVSTAEVATVLCRCAGVVDAVVYGVTVPGTEGRAGMAAITTDERFEFATLAAHLKAHLPDYAHPQFVRLCSALDTTGTFKLTKTNLAREGYSKTSDPIWCWDREYADYIWVGPLS
jgi:fatty-acyl-CoA synthase